MKTRISQSSYLPQKYIIAGKSLSLSSKKHVEQASKNDKSSQECHLRKKKTKGKREAQREREQKFRARGIQAE